MHIFTYIQIHTDSSIQTDTHTHTTTSNNKNLDIHMANYTLADKYSHVYSVINTHSDTQT